jgi:Trk K+ transport system NAD-binding subunit
MICNAGPEDLNVAGQLVMHNEKVYIFDDDPDTVQKAQEAGIHLVVAHVSNPTNLQEFRELGVRPFVPAIAGPILY